MNPIQPAPYNLSPRSSILKKLLSTPEKVPDSTSLRSMVSKVAKRIILTSDQRLERRRSASRKRYLANLEKERKRCLDRSRRDDVKEMRSKRYWANPESFRKKRVDSYSANIKSNREKNNINNKKFRLRKSGVKKLEEELTKIQNNPPELLFDNNMNDCLEVALDIIETCANKV